MANIAKVDGLAVAAAGAVGQACMRAYRNAAQAIPTAANTTVQLNVEDYDVRDEFDSTVNYQFVAKDAGYYVIDFQVRFTDASPANSYAALVEVNAVPRSYASIHTDGTIATARLVPHGSDILYLNAGDIVELMAWHDAAGGGAVNTVAGTHNTFMSISKIASIGVTGSPRCKVHTSGDQNIPILANTTVQFDTEDYDLFDEWDIVNYRFTAKEEGYYLFDTQLYWNATEADKRYAVRIRNTTIPVTEGYSSSQSSIVDELASQCHAVVHLQAGDVIEIHAYHTSAGVAPVKAGNYWTFACISKLDCSGGGGFNSRVQAYYAAGVQAIASGVWTKYNLDSVMFDGKGEFDAVNGRIAISEAGYYQVNGNIDWDAAVTDRMYGVAIFVNAVERLSSIGQSGDNTRLMRPCVSGVLYLDAGDLVELYGFQDSGANRNVSPAARGEYGLNLHRLS